MPCGPFRWIKDAPPELRSWVPVSPQPAMSRGGSLVRYPLVEDERVLRPRPYAPVATPLRRDELDADMTPHDLTMRAVAERVRAVGDVYRPVLSGRQRLDRALAAAAA